MGKVQVKLIEKTLIASIEAKINEFLEECNENLYLVHEIRTAKYFGIYLTEILYETRNTKEDWEKLRDRAIEKIEEMVSK